MLKNTVKDKKELKEKRNIQTAKLSRDRKKLEVEFMRENALNYIKCLNRIRNYLNNVVQQNGKESGFASKIIKRIKKFSDDLPQNFEFIEDKSTNLDEMSDHFSSLDLTIANLVYSFFFFSFFSNLSESDENGSCLPDKGFEPISRAFLF